MTVSYRQAAGDDVVRQFRYYLVTLNLPDVALRFRGVLSRVPFNHCGSIPLRDRVIVQVIQKFKFFAHGRSPDLKLSESTTFRARTASAWYGFCTGSAILSAFLKLREGEIDPHSPGARTA